MVRSKNCWVLGTPSRGHSVAVKLYFEGYLRSRRGYFWSSGSS